MGQQGPLCPRHLPLPLGGSAEASTNPVSWFVLLTNPLLPRVHVVWSPAPQQSSMGSSVLWQVAKPSVGRAKIPYSFFFFFFSWFALFWFPVFPPWYVPNNCPATSVSSGSGEQASLHGLGGRHVNADSFVFPQLGMFLRAPAYFSVLFLQGVLPPPAP